MVVFSKGEIGRLRRIASRKPGSINRRLKYGMPVLIVLAVVSMLALAVGWFSLWQQAQIAHLSIREVNYLAGCWGKPLSAQEADLVKSMNIYFMATLFSVLIVTAPFFAYLDTREALLREKLVRRLLEMGEQF